MNINLLVNKTNSEATLIHNYPSIKEPMALYECYIVDNNPDIILYPCTDKLYDYIAEIVNDDVTYSDLVGCKVRIMLA